MIRSVSATEFSSELCSQPTSGVLTVIKNHCQEALTRNRQNNPLPSLEHLLQYVSAMSRPHSVKPSTVANSQSGSRPTTGDSYAEPEQSPAMSVSNGSDIWKPAASSDLRPTLSAPPSLQSFPTQTPIVVPASATQQQMQQPSVEQQIRQRSPSPLYVHSLYPFFGPVSLDTQLVLHHFDVDLPPAHVKLLEA